MPTSHPSYNETKITVAFLQCSKKAMNMSPQQTENLASYNQRAPEDIYIALFKCTRWQAEETMDPLNCPFHYFCESTYPGNYPPNIDILLLLFTAASYLATLLLLGMELYRGTKQTSLPRVRKYLLPSGPISLPVFLIALAKGQRINTIFPLTSTGPAILQLIQISALAFDLESQKDIMYAFFKASTISGILHTSLYLDSIILPYYTGFDALVSSTFSGECKTCICRKEILVAGGNIVSYRGLSKTTFFVIATLCLRIICRLPADNKHKTTLIESILENFSWISIAIDCIYVVTNSPPERSILRSAASASLLILICLCIVRKACRQITKRQSYCKVDTKICT